MDWGGDHSQTASAQYAGYINPVSPYTDIAIVKPPRILQVAVREGRRRNEKDDSDWLDVDSNPGPQS